MTGNMQGSGSFATKNSEKNPQVLRGRIPAVTLEKKPECEKDLRVA